MNYPLLLVSWLDHSSSTEWKSLKEVSESQPYTCTTIGWLIHEDRKTIKLCNSLVKEDPDTVGGESLILKKNIVSREEITFA